MIDTAHVKTFRITIRDEDKIEVLHNLENVSGDLNGSVKREPLLWQTVEAFIRILRDNRLRTGKRFDEFAVLGKNLWSVLLDNEIGEELIKLLRVDEENQLRLLRVVLEFGPKQDVLSAWPWEYLYVPERQGRVDRDYFLATRARLVLTRQLKLDRYRPLPVKEPKLRVLFVSASPSNLDPVEYSGLLETLEGLQKAGRIDLMTLVDKHVKDPVVELGPAWEPSATKKRLFNMAATWGAHVIHFVGHGQADDMSEIAFMGQNGQVDWLPENEFKLGEIPSVRLVFLQACESARELADPYHAMSGFARQVAAQGIPAVVGMQFRVQNAVANKFAQAFYNALADRDPVDVAVQKGRREIQNDLGHQRAFGLPVLYFQIQEAKDGVLLPPDMSLATAAVSPPQPPVSVSPHP